MSTQSVPHQFPLPADLGLRAGTKHGPVAVGHRPHRALSLETPKVRLSEICLSYRAQPGEHLLALDHINLEVRAGEFLCVVGPSGCGKSTLLHLIAGLHTQTSGQILVDGNPLENISDIRKVSAVFAAGKMYQPAALWSAVGFKQ